MTEELSSEEPADDRNPPPRRRHGASSGIGFELAKQFAANGFDVILTATSGLAGEAVHYEGGSVVRSVEADLSTQDSVNRLYELIRAEGGRSPR